MSNTRSLDCAYVSKINALYQSIKIRDIVTSEHSCVMAYYAHLIAREFDPDNKEDYYLGGLIHDVGKIAMTDDILKGTGILSEDERNLVQGHVTNGVHVLKECGIDGIAFEMTKYHHERFDGSGYCEGLSGYEIPLSGRISAVADTYATLVGGRRYSKRITHGDAQLIMYKEAYLFDKDILDWFFGQSSKTISGTPQRMYRVIPFEELEYII